MFVIQHYVPLVLPVNPNLHETQDAKESHSFKGQKKETIFSAVMHSPLGSSSSYMRTPLHSSLLLLESVGEATDVVGELAVVGQELDVGAVVQDLSLLAQLDVLLAA